MSNEIAALRKQVQELQRAVQYLQDRIAKLEGRGLPDARCEISGRAVPVSTLTPILNGREFISDGW